MRHIFKCVECGADFEKVDAGVLCAGCLNKPAPELVMEVETKPKAESKLDPQPAKAKSKKTLKKKGKKL